MRHVTDRVAIMYLGRFVETGPTADIFRQATHPYTAALLAANPAPDPDKRPERIELVGDVPSLLRRPAGCEFHTRCFRTQQLCREEAPEVTRSSSGCSFTCHYPLVPEKVAEDVPVQA